MKTDGSASSMRFAQCRTLGRQIRRSPNWPAVRGTLRPRGFAWVFRSRAPVSVLLYLAAHDDRLLTDGGGAYALVVPPTANAEGKQAATDLRVLRALDKHWDLLQFLTLGLLLLGAEALLLVLQMVTAGLVVATALMSFVAVLMGVGIVGEIARIAAGRKRLIDVAVGQLRAQHWTILMLHSPQGVEAARRLIGRALDSVVGDQQRILILRDGLTHVSPAGESTDLYIQKLSPHHPVLVAYRPSAPPWDLPVESGKLPGRAVGLLLIATAIMVLILAWFVAEEEARICAPSCEGVPAAYGDALYWLLSRMIGGDPDGLGAASPGSRILGLLMTIFGVYVLVTIIGRVLQQRMEEDARSGREVVVAFEKLRPNRFSVIEAAADAGTPRPPQQPPPAPPQRPQARTQIAVGLFGLLIGLLGGVVLRQYRRTDSTCVKRSS